MKISSRIWIETEFCCRLCGKKFKGEKAKTDRKYDRHLLFRHPLYVTKELKKAKRAGERGARK